MNQNTNNSSGLVRCVIKDMDTGKILFDERMGKGSAFNIPDDYDIISQEVNDFGENWFYVKQSGDNVE